MFIYFFFFFYPGIVCLLFFLGSNHLAFVSSFAIAWGSIAEFGVLITGGLCLLFAHTCLFPEWWISHLAMCIFNSNVNWGMKASAVKRLPLFQEGNNSNEWINTTLWDPLFLVLEFGTILLLFWTFQHYIIKKTIIA